MSITKETLETLHSLRRVGQGLQIHKNRMVESAARTLGAGGGPLVEAFCDVGIAALERVKARISTTENRFQQELGDNPKHLGVRDARVAAGRDAFMDVRSAATLSWNAEVAEELGCGSVTPENPEALRLALERIVEHWNARRGSLPEPRIQVDLDAAVQRAKDAAEGITAALEELSRDVTEDREARTDRRAALDEGLQVFEAVADAASGFLRLAGQKKLAEQLRPSKRRPGRTTAVAEGQDPVLEDPNAPLPAPPVEDAPAAAEEDAA